MSDAMLGSFLAITVRPEQRQAFWDATIFAAQSVISEERGVFQFHVMVDATNQNRFYVYEVFQDEAAVQAHRDTPVYKSWWETVQPMLEGDMETIANFRSLFPTAQGFKAQKPGLLQW